MKSLLLRLVLLSAIGVFAGTDFFTADPNTIALWRFNEGVGDSVHDASGNGHHGKFNKIPNWSAVYGVTGSGVLFDGATYAKVPNPGAFNLAGSFVLEARLQIPTGYTPGFGRVLGCHVYGRNTVGYVWTSCGSLFESYNDLGQTSTSTSRMPYISNTWMVVKMAYDSASQTVRFFRDNVPVDSFTRNLGTIKYAPLPLVLGGELGSDSVTGTYLFQGIIDEIKISRIIPCAGPALSLVPLASPTFNRKPLFQWRRDARVSTYKFLIGTSASLADPLINLPLADTAYQPTINLPYDTLYYGVSDYDNGVCPSRVASLIIQDSMQPSITVAPAGISATVAPGDSATKTLRICNPGRDTLDYVVNRNSAVGTCQVLAWTYYADMTEEFPRTLAAIRQYTPGCVITNTATLVADTLRAQLAGKQAFLITEPTSTLSSTYGTVFGPVLRDFVSGGGVVIFCFPSSYNNAFINATGLVSLSYSSNVSSTTLTLALPGHPLLRGVTAPLYAANATAYFQALDSAQIVVSYSGYAVVTDKALGRGHVITLGPDFYAADSNWARVISNAVQMAMTTPSWIVCRPDSGRVLPGQCTDLSVVFKPLSLAGTVFTGQISVGHNSPYSADPFLVPCTLTLPPPGIALTAFSASADLATGDTLTRIIRITNTGGSPLEIGVDGNPGTGHSVVINEVSTDIDHIELWNRGPDIVVGGWRLTWTDNTGTSGSYTIPAGIRIRSGKLMSFVESSGTPSDSCLYMGNSLGWVSGTTLSVTLTDNTSRAVDFMKTQGDLTTPPAGTAWFGTSLSTAYGWYRNRNTDTDSASDWSLAASGGYSFIRLNPGQTTDFTAPTAAWLTARCDTLTIMPGASSTLRLGFTCLSDLISGLYIDSLRIGHNASGMASPVMVRCSLSVRSVIPAIIPVTPDPTPVRRPLFAWHLVPAVTYYTIQINTAPDFSTTFITQPVSDTFYSPAVDLPRGAIYWRVKSDLSPLFSRVDSFTIQTDSIPLLIRIVPDSTLNRRPILRWHAARGAATYKIQIDTGSRFTSPFVTLPVADTFFVPTFNLPYGRIYWRVSNMSYNENLFSAADSFKILLNTGTEEPDALPVSFGLEQNYPNPFNPSTRFRFAVPPNQVSAMPRVFLGLYDMKGRLVRTLVQGAVAPGYHSIEFDGHADQGGLLPSGLYVCRMKAGHFRKSIRLFMMK